MKQLILLTFKICRLVKEIPVLDYVTLFLSPFVNHYGSKSYPHCHFCLKQIWNFFMTPYIVYINILLLRCFIQYILQYYWKV